MRHSVVPERFESPAPGGNAAAVLLSGDLLFGSKLAGAAQQAGVSLEVISRADDLMARAATGTWKLVLVDLGAPGLDVRALVQSLRDADRPPCTILAFGPHVHTERLNAAAQAGCDQVLSRGELNAKAVSLLRHFASE